MIDIKQEPYLPLSFRMGGYFLAVLGVLRIVSTVMTSFNLLALLLGITLILIGAVLITAHYRLLIDVKNKTYHEYVWLLSTKTGSPISFEFIDKIYVNQLKESTGYSSRSGRRFESTEIIFKSFMRLDDGEKIHLDTDKNEQELNKRVNKIIAELGNLYKPE